MFQTRDGLVLVVADGAGGLCDYLPMADVGRLTMNGSTLGELVEAFMLPKRGLPDDVAVIRCCLVDPAAR